MKRMLIGLFLCLAAAVQAQVPPVKAAAPTGSVQIAVNYQEMNFQETWSNVWFYDADWNPIPRLFPYFTGPSGGGTLVIEDIPVGDYYVKFSVWLEDCGSQGGSEHGFCVEPYIPEYYNNSLTQGGAVKIHVSASDTTVLNPVWIETDHFICVTTSPKAFYVNLGDPGSIHGRAPLYLPWKAGQTHFIGVDARIDVQGWVFPALPDGARYDFKEWKHGGPRNQNYTIPAGTKKDTLVARYTFMYRLDISSPHGNPWGGGWGTAWRDTLIGVEPAVVEKIPPHAFPAKALTPADTDSVRYVFERWQGTGSGSYSGTDNPAAVLMNFHIMERAFWKTQFRLVVQVPDTSMGTVSVDPPGLWQDRGDTVSLTAEPKTGFAFSGWEGSLGGTAATDSVVMDTTKTVIARFVRSLHPPVIAMPDTGWAEEDTLFLAKSEFSRWVSYPADPFADLSLSPESTSGTIHSRMDVDGIRLWSDPDWNGTGWVVFGVSDPAGSSASDTVRCRITAIDDPPGPFELVSPPEDFVVVDSTEAFKFIWRTSRNRDAANGDTIQYAFCFGKEGGDLDTLSLAADTSFVWPGGDRPANGAYLWKVQAVDRARNAEWSASERKLRVAIKSGLEDGRRMPVEYGLSHNYPNPFNPSTEISYTLREKVRVRIEIYSLAGRKIRTLVDRDRPAGEYTVDWDGADDSGRHVGSGIYVCRMSAGRFVKTIKMAVAR